MDGFPHRVLPAPLALSRGVHQRPYTYKKDQPMTNLNTTTSPAPRYMRPAAASKYLQIGKSTLYAWLATRPDFPKPTKAGARVTLFDVSDLDRFMAACRA